MQITGSVVSSAVPWKLKPVAARISPSSGLTEPRIGRRFRPRATSSSQATSGVRVSALCMQVLPALVERGGARLGQVPHRQALLRQG